MKFKSHINFAYPTNMFQMGLEQKEMESNNPFTSRSKHFSEFSLQYQHVIEWKGN